MSRRKVVEVKFDPTLDGNGGGLRIADRLTVSWAGPDVPARVRALLAELGATHVVKTGDDQGYAQECTVASFLRYVERLARGP